MHIVQRSVIRPLEGGGRNQRLGLLTASCTARKPLFSATPSACAAVMASCSRSRLFNAVCYTRRHTQWARFGRSALQTLNCCSQRTSCAPRGGCSRRISKGPMGPFGSNTVCRSAGPTEHTQCASGARYRKTPREPQLKPTYSHGRALLLRTDGSELRLQLVHLPLQLSAAGFSLAGRLRCR
jgi:hypothetical protein